MRIGFLLPSEFSVGNPGNGIAAQARFQAEALQQLGHDIVRLTPWDWTDANELDVVHSFASEHAISNLNATFGSRRRFLLAYSPIIDSNQSFFAYRQAARLGTLLPRVTTVPALLQQESKSSDVVICRSVHEQRRVTEGLGVAQSRTEIVLNGCPAPSHISVNVRDVQQQLKLPSDFVLHISAFTQDRKNVLRLVEAAEACNYPLVIAGRAMSGNVLDTLQRKAAANPNIRILGFIDEATKAALYSLCKVFCLPSFHEGTGLVAVEAASYGANIVITQNGGPSDYFLHHVDYVDPFSVKSIQSALERAWGRAKSTALKQHVLDNLSWTQSAEALITSYTKHLIALRSRSGDSQ